MGALTFAGVHCDASQTLMLVARGRLSSSSSKQNRIALLVPRSCPCPSAPVPHVLAGSSLDGKRVRTDAPQKLGALCGLTDAGTHADGSNGQTLNKLLALLRVRNLLEGLRDVGTRGSCAVSAAS